MSSLPMLTFSFSPVETNGQEPGIIILSAFQDVGLGIDLFSAHDDLVFRLGELSHLNRYSAQEGVFNVLFELGGLQVSS
jgi:hypothetical protein